MALKKKDDGFEKIKLEAEENGINLSKAADGTYSAMIVGGASLDEYPDARVLLDDMLAIQEMDEKDDLYAYDNGPMGGYQVAVTGVEKPFEHETLAGAFALAKESLIPKVVEKPKVVTIPKVVESKTTLNPNQPIVAQLDAEDEKVEVLAPSKPNGREVAQMRRDDLAETLAQGILDLASQLTAMATSLRSQPGTIPFVQQGFEEGLPEAAVEGEASPKPARSRISRERKG